MNKEVIFQQLSTISGRLKQISEEGIKLKESPYEVLIALGTLGAVAVALFAVFWPSIIAWWKKPRLKFEFENKEPFCRHTFGKTSLDTGMTLRVNSYYVRLRIKNIGRSIARRCEGKLVAIAHKDLKSLRQDFDPVVLHWVGSDTFIRNFGGGITSIQQSKNFTIDINSKEYEYLDLISIDENSNHYLIQAIDYDIPRGIVLDPQRDDYYFLVTAYAENSNPISEIYKVIDGQTYDSVKLKVASTKEREEFYALIE